MPSTLATAALTDTGRVRGRNEDAFVLDPALGLAAVADGMGGHPAGDVASALAVSELQRQLATGDVPPGAPPADPASPSPLGERMLAAVHRVDARVRAAAANDPALAGMGTTLTALVVRPDEERVTIGHVGDSRAYLFAEGRLEQLTRDHTWVQAQVDGGVITAAEARGHRWGHVLSQSLGSGTGVRPDLVEVALDPDGVYLLCTDGLTTMLPDRDIASILAEEPERGLDATAGALVGEANARGGVDNITVVLVRVRRGGGAESPG